MRRNMFRGQWMAGLLALLALTMVAGCSGGRSYEDLDMDQAWSKINNYYDRGRYLDAAEHLEIFIINYAGSTLADSAQYLLAESHFEMKEYIIAASEYQKLITQYPRSPLVEEGEYKLGLSYYELSPSYHKDQEYTEKAIEMFQLFIEDFENSSLAPEAQTRIEELRAKLARKEYSAGRLYHKMGEEESARIYYQSVLDNYYDSRFAPLAQLYKAESWADEERWSEAIAAFNAYLSRYGDHEYADYARDALTSARLRYQKQLDGEEEESPFDAVRLDEE